VIQLEKKMRKTHALVGLILLLPLLSGCPLLRWLGFPVGDKVPYNPKEESSGVSIKRDVQFADLPVPMGFEIIRDKSFSFSGHSFRYANFRYEGAWTFRRTTAFYLEQMGVSGWTLEDSRSEGYAASYIYRKGRERCRVNVESTPETVVVEMLVNAATGGETLAAKR
jgi:hypothetical protein